MGNERLDEELAQNAGDRLDLDVLGRASLDPLLGLSPGLVEREEAGLPSALDQLVGLRDELCAGSQQPRVGGLGLVQDILDGGVFGEVDGGESGRGIVGGRGRQGRGLDNGGASEMVVEDGLAVGLEDRFGRHCEGERGSTGYREGELKERREGREKRKLKES